MAFFLLLPLSSLSPLSLSHSSPSLVVPANAISRLQRKPFCIPSRSFNGFWIRDRFPVPERQLVIARALDDVNGKDPKSPDPPKETSENTMPFEKLPLESKVQMMLEQKKKMKIAKKIRLRRKRLLRKRHWRKKGRWPPSKMKKLKNV